MVASLLLWLVDPLDRPIDFASLGASVPEIVRQLSVSTDLKIKAGPSVQSQTLVLQIHDMPVRKLLDLIAEALGAGWKQEAGEITIWRSDKQEREQAAAERQALMAALKKWQDAPLPPPFTEEKARSIVQRSETSTKMYPPESGKTADHNAEMIAIAREAPGYRASIYLRKTLDLSLLAQVRKGRRIVFSSRPNQLQKPLKNAESSINRFATEISMMQPYAEASLSRVPESQSALDPRRWPAQMKGRPDRVILAVYRLPGVPMIPIRTYFVSGNQIVGWVSDTIDPSPTDAKPLPDAKFKLDAELVKLTQNRSDFQNATAKRYVANKTEPAAWLLGPLMRGYSEARKLDLVASVPDSAIDMSANLWLDGGNEMPRLQTVAKRFLVWSEHDGVLVFSPKAPVEERSNTFDRVRMWDLSRRFMAEGRPTLEAVAEYLADEPVEPVNDVILSRITLWSTGVNWGFGFWGTSPPLRFWGRIPSSGRIGTTTVGRLNTRARTALDEWVFGTNLALQAIEIDVIDPTSGNDIRRLEPTERYPDGFPGDMPLTFKIDNMASIWRKYGDEAPWSERLEYAYSLLDALNAPELMVAPDTQRLWAMYFNNDPKMRVESEEPTSQSHLKWIAPKDLPESILERLRASAKKYKQESSTVRGTPPP